MTIEKMNEQLKKYDAIIEDATKKRNMIKHELDLALAAQAQKIFTKHHISAEELMKLKDVSADQLKAFFESIDDGAESEKNVKEIKENAKEIKP